MPLMLYDLVKVVNPFGDSTESILINAHDFDEKVHILFDEQSQEPKKKRVRLKTEVME